MRERAAVGEDQCRRKFPHGDRLLLLVVRHARLQVAEQPMGRERRVEDGVQLQRGDIRQDAGPVAGHGSYRRRWHFAPGV